MLNYLAKDKVFQSRLLHTRSLSECTISYGNLDLAVSGSPGRPRGCAPRKVNNLFLCSKYG